jgi:hypothetical protein
VNFGNEKIFVHNAQEHDPRLIRGPPTVAFLRIAQNDSRCARAETQTTRVATRVV